MRKPTITNEQAGQTILAVLEESKQYGTMFAYDSMSELNSSFEMAERSIQRIIQGRCEQPSADRTRAAVDFAAARELTYRQQYEVWTSGD